MLPLRHSEGNYKKKYKFIKSNSGSSRTLNWAQKEVPSTRSSVNSVTPLLRLAPIVALRYIKIKHPAVMCSRGMVPKITSPQSLRGKVTYCQAPHPLPHPPPLPPPLSLTAEMWQVGHVYICMTYSMNSVFMQHGPLWRWQTELRPITVFFLKAPPLFKKFSIGSFPGVGGGRNPNWFWKESISVCYN